MPSPARLRRIVSESFAANGLMLEEVTIVALEQSTKEYFRSDNVFDAEGLKVITEITSEARRKVHTTEKQTTVAIRNKDLTTQLELLEIERQEAVALASQDKEVANEQAKQLREKQTFVLDQRLAVEQREIENEKALEQLRTERDIAFTAEAKRREIAQVQKELALEQERRDREIALIGKAREAEIAEIERSLAGARRARQVDRACRQGARAPGGRHRTRHGRGGCRRAGPRPAPSGGRGNRAFRAQAHAGNAARHSAGRS